MALIPRDDVPVSPISFSLYHQSYPHGVHLSRGIYPVQPHSHIEQNTLNRRTRKVEKHLLHSAGTGCFDTCGIPRLRGASPRRKTLILDIAQMNSYEL